METEQVYRIMGTAYRCRCDCQHQYQRRQPHRVTHRRRLHHYHSRQHCRHRHRLEHRLTQRSHHHQTAIWHNCQHNNRNRLIHIIICPNLILKSPAHMHQASIFRIHLQLANIIILPTMNMSHIPLIHQHPPHPCTPHPFKIWCKMFSVRIVWYI